MVLHPLEFSECFMDSPWFRQSIKEYEDELERTNSQIKQLIKDAKSMLQASRKQGEMMQVFSDRMQKFKFEIIGENLTDDERGIAGSLKEFGMMLEEIEGEWTRTIERSELQLIQPLENFRKDHIHSYREAKKTFDKTSDRYYKQMEQNLGLSHKKKENQLLESDNELLMQKRNFHQVSLNYVYKLQEVQERKKFEFVEHLLMFMQVYFNFFHQTHETAIDCKEYMNDIQMRLVSTRSQYEGTRDKTQMLMRKMMDNPSSQASDNATKNSSPNRVIGQRWARAGYLQLLEKNALGSRFAAKWTRFFCMYTKENKLFQMLPPVTQSSSSSNVATKMAAINHGHLGAALDPLIVISCTRRQTDSIDKRFCFDIDVEDSAGKQVVLTLQASSNDDRKKWLAVMDGKEPNYIMTKEYKKPDQFVLNPTSIQYVEDVISEIERRGVEAEGIYRLVGVASKVDRLLQIVMDPNIHGKLNYQDESEWELNTLTSALKNFFRNLPEPIMTFDMHEDFIMAAKRENPEERLNRVINLVAKLSTDSQRILKQLIGHLQKVAAQNLINKMTVQNIGVCFGPTLMRPRQETVQSIMEIKFNNIIVEILIENYTAIFGSDDNPKSKDEKAHLPKPNIDRLPSQRFKTRPKAVHEPFDVEAIAEEDHHNQSQSANNLHPLQYDPSSRFTRGHAIRGPPGRPLSPRSQMKVVGSKTDSGNDNASLSSSDNNTDEFGRISPLDLNLNLDHHFTTNKPPSPGYVNLEPKTQSVSHLPGERVLKEDWNIESERHVVRKSSSKRQERMKRNARSSQSERSHSPVGRNLISSLPVYASVKKSGNENQNNSVLKSPTVRQRKERLLGSLRNTQHDAPHKATSVKRRIPPVMGARPLVKSNHGNDVTVAVDIEKLKEKFTHDQQDISNDHSMSFLWPKPGSIKANTYVEANSPQETRPRSTVVSSRDAVTKAQDRNSKLVNEGEIFPPKDLHASSEETNSTLGVRVFQTLFACEAEHESELSFGPGELILDVMESDEPGWLVGKLKGVEGLIPANYVREQLWN